MPIFFLALILLAFPVLEIWLMVELSHRYGWWLFAYLVTVGLLGWRLVREEKLMVLGKAMQSVGQGGSLSGAVFSSVKNLLAGVLLIIPGVISDAIAIVLLFLPAPSQTRNARGAGRRAANDDVIEGEFRRED